MASIGMLPRSLRSRGSVKDVWRHFVKDVMRLNTGFGLSGDVQILSILSSRPEQITARAVICGVEGPGVVTSTGCEGQLKIKSE